MSHIGARPRFNATTLEERVAKARETVALVRLKHPKGDLIKSAFIEVYREMESDCGLDGACHLLAPLGHILLLNLGVENTLCMGEVQDFPCTFTHSWVEIHAIKFDVAGARPLIETIHGSSVLNETEIPSGKRTGRTYGVPGEVDYMAAIPLERGLAAFAVIFKKLSGIDFWLWVQVVCRRAGIAKATAAKLREKHKNVRWTLMG